MEDSELNKSQCIQLQLLLTMTELSTEYQYYQSYLTLLSTLTLFLGIELKIISISQIKKFWNRKI